VSKETVAIINEETRQQPEVVVKEKTLKQVYEEAGLDMDHLTIDAFNVLAGKEKDCLHAGCTNPATTGHFCDDHAVV
jgi:hypothetical protein